MHLGTLLSLSTVVLLATEILAALGLFRLSRQVDGRPGGHLLRIITRTVGLVVLAQMLEVATDVSLDAAPETTAHATIIVLEVISLFAIFIAVVWAWWDLTRHDFHR